MRSKNLLISGILGGVGLLGIVEGQMVITQEESAPVGNVVASHNPLDTSTFTNALLKYVSNSAVNGRRIWGQSFYNAQEGQIIDKITLKFWQPGTYSTTAPINTGAPGVEVLMEIYKVESPAQKHVDFNSPLASWTGNLPMDLAATSAADPQFLVFDVPNEFVMEANTYYAFMYQFTSQGSAREIHFAYLGGGGGGYNDGRVIYYNLNEVEGEWEMVEQNSNTDLAFVVTTIPEPATVGLLGLAGVFFLKRRKK